MLCMHTSVGNPNIFSEFKLLSNGGLRLIVLQTWQVNVERFLSIFIHIICVFGVIKMIYLLHSYAQLLFLACSFDETRNAVIMTFFSMILLVGVNKTLGFNWHCFLLHATLHGRIVYISGGLMLVSLFCRSEKGPAQLQEVRLVGKTCFQKKKRTSFQRTELSVIQIAM